MNCQEETDEVMRIRNVQRAAISRAPGRRREERRRLVFGYSLLEIMVVLVLTAFTTAVAIPSVFAWTRSLRMRLAAAEVVGAMQSARLYAIRHHANVALKFRADAQGGVSWTLYRDEDGDGVRNDDIAAGRDPQLGNTRNLTHFGRLARLGFPPDIVPRDPGSGKRMDRLDDPVRFNRSDLASWSELGTSTPGSVYITDGHRALWAVRVNQEIGRMRVLVYDATTETWTQD